ncbi:hypothetical protein [Enhygromyxa salina]|uniref:hypothetical protein n=1 Tax=Enhygromyxa salina TaxID=215803 RepID=UPI0004E79F8E|nr:hypothetical protein [Enhygromyxa salina]
MLTLVQLSFDEGAAVASLTAKYQRRVIDPVASANFDEARQLLLRPAPNLPLALMALWCAANREPDCYGQTHAGVLGLLLHADQDTAEAELAAATEFEPAAELTLQKRS